MIVPIRISIHNRYKHICSLLHVDSDANDDVSIDNEWRDSISTWIVCRIYRKYFVPYSFMRIMFMIYWIVDIDLNVELHNSHT